jgi:hypothetical protein
MSNQVPGDPVPGDQLPTRDHASCGTHDHVTAGQAFRRHAGVVRTRGSPAQHRLRRRPGACRKDRCRFSQRQSSS